MLYYCERCDKYYCRERRYYITCPYCGFEVNKEIQESYKFWE